MHSRVQKCIAPSRPPTEAATLARQLPELQIPKPGMGQPARWTLVHLHLTQKNTRMQLMKASSQLHGKASINTNSVNHKHQQAASSTATTYRFASRDGRLSIAPFSEIHPCEEEVCAEDGTGSGTSSAQRRLGQQILGPRQGTHTPMHLRGEGRGQWERRGG